MFGFLKAKKADVLGHWYTLIPNFNSSTQDFYQLVEQELKERQVPGLQITHEEFAEGGILSDKREYLRMTREWLVFDVCAAPFGTSYFFSCRFAELPAVVKLWQLAVLVVAILGVLALFWKVLGFGLGLVVLTVLIGIGVYLLRNAVAMGLRDLDAALIKMPVLGPVYAVWFRKETYYRQDTRLMYCHTVDEVVKAKLEETTGAKGITLIRYNEHSPILRDLYKPTDVRPNEKLQAA